MLNIGRMAPGGEGYYLASVADGLEDYYLGRGEAPGRWLGAGTERLGLSGEVAGEDLSAVLEGLDADGQPLLGQAQRKVPGFDLTFRAPKSVSLLYGLGDAATSREVSRAHDAAVEATVGYLERTVLRCRRGRGGTEQVATTGAVAAAFGHRTSRAGDPLLHTHLLVANLAQAQDDGRWRTVDSRRLYVHAKTAGYLYQAQLRHELTRRLGLEWGEVDNGTADLKGVPRELIETFSTRRAQILDALEARGESSARAAQIATLDTRPAKADLDPERLTHRWRRQAHEAGFDPDQLVHNLLAAGRTIDQPDQHDGAAEAADRLLGPAGLTAHASTFTRRDVLRGWAEQLPAGPRSPRSSTSPTLSSPRAGWSISTRPTPPSARSPQRTSSAGPTAPRSPPPQTSTATPPPSCSPSNSNSSTPRSPDSTSVSRSPTPPTGRRRGRLARRSRTSRPPWSPG